MIDIGIILLFCSLILFFFSSIKVSIVILINETDKNDKISPYFPAKGSNAVLCNQKVTGYCESTDPLEFCASQIFSGQL